jgi:hypothetical protein
MASSVCKRSFELRAPLRNDSMLALTPQSGLASGVPLSVEGCDRGLKLSADERVLEGSSRSLASGPSRSLLKLAAAPGQLFSSGLSRVLGGDSAREHVLELEAALHSCLALLCVLAHRGAEALECSGSLSELGSKCGRASPERHVLIADEAGRGQENFGCSSRLLLLRTRRSR